LKRKIKHIDLYKHLSQEELLDYNEGVLGSDELYRLELHLNECELCNDALEGIAQLKNPSTTLASLSEEIFPHQQKKINVNYMAIAASVALIAVFGLSYWLINKSSIKEESLALNNATEIESPNKKIEPVKEAPPQIIDEPKSEVTENEMDGVDTEQITSNRIEETKPSALVNPVAGVQINKAQGAETKVEEETEALEGISDDESAFTEEEVDFQPSETVSEPARKGKRKVQQAIPSASRLAKTGADNTVAKFKDRKDPIPEGGMDALKLFIKKNLKYPQQAIDNNVKGTVVLDVTILPDGTIKNIIVTKSVGSGCDAEAMRLVTIGPKWLPAVVDGSAIESKRQLKVKFKN
jgi:TonB family protein